MHFLLVIQNLLLGKQQTGASDDMTSRSYAANTPDVLLWEYRCAWIETWFPADILRLMPHQSSTKISAKVYSLVKAPLH